MISNEVSLHRWSDPQVDHSFQCHVILEVLKAVIHMDPLASLLFHLLLKYNSPHDPTPIQWKVRNLWPGYLYGNVKTLEIGIPLRPIVSQIPTPTYQLAKRLNALLTPLDPADYCYRSSTEFLDCVNSAPAEGEMAPLDAGSQFTCVPVSRTIDYICDHVYRSSAHPLLAVDEYHLRELLRICTQESPFRFPRGNLYQQEDGVSMGSPLGVLFANFFMGSVEKEVLNRIRQPIAYGRYVDDIFVRTQKS
ncbi:uncharacterized protein LOC143036107 [Oratosquilla oratoria]|uniref:uncharacterized protein LOC143036107 n=1 Tax=Oratosquilla oratoria TaxID=337810 RepID=UPI003F75DD0F